MWKRVQDLRLTTQKDGGGVLLRNVVTHHTSRYHIREAYNVDFLLPLKFKPVVIEHGPVDRETEFIISAFALILFFLDFLCFGMIANPLACYITQFSGIVLKESFLVALGFVGD